MAKCLVSAGSMYEDFQLDRLLSRCDKKSDAGLRGAMFKSLGGTVEDGVIRRRGNSGMALDVSDHPLPLPVL